MRITILVVPTLLLVAGCAPNPEAEARQIAKADVELAKQLDGLVETGVDSCIPAETRSTIIDDHRIVWREGVGGTAWVSALDVPCPGMRPDDALIVHRFGSQLCRMDTIQPFTPGMGNIPGPRCVLGNFVRYEKPKG